MVADRSPESRKRRASEPPREPGSFEDSVRRLGEIVEQLESGELALEESLALFEEGVRLARQSQTKLDEAERRVEQLLGIDEEGNPVVKELESE
jgi:exodeoxyribonuclease VII small subunit